MTNIITPMVCYGIGAMGLLIVLVGFALLVTVALPREYGEGSEPFARSAWETGVDDPLPFRHPDNTFIVEGTGSGELLKIDGPGYFVIDGKRQSAQPIDRDAMPTTQPPLSGPNSVGVALFGPEPSAVITMLVGPDHKGFVPPPMTAAQRDALPHPLKGLIVEVGGKTWVYLGWKEVK